jgi:site-specific recombinase XerC
MTQPWLREWMRTRSSSRPWEDRPMAELPKPKRISSRRVIERMTQNAYNQGGNELAREVRRRAVALAEKKDRESKP